jgi:hypothetical protein
MKFNESITNQRLEKQFDGVERVFVIGKERKILPKT